MHAELVVVMVMIAVLLLSYCGIVVVGICAVCQSVCRAATAGASLSAEPRLQARRISLGGEGNALYPVFSSCCRECVDGSLQLQRSVVRK